jgi:hypothetical protein
MSLPYYKYFPAEDLGNYKIMSLPHDALGVWYLLTICHLWQHQGRIPDDPDYIAPLLKLTTGIWNTHRAEFLKRGLIQVIDGCITVAALRDKWLKAQAYSEDQTDKRNRAIAAKKQADLLRKGNKIR